MRPTVRSLQRTRKAEHLGSLEVHGHFVFRWKLRRKIARLLAAQNAIDIIGQPKPASAGVNAEMRAFARGWFSIDMSTPMRRTRSPCCARAASGHAAATRPPRKSRRRMDDTSPGIGPAYLGPEMHGNRAST